MHEIMVKGLPSKCRLTAIFDVSTNHYGLQTHHYSLLQACPSGTPLGSLVSNAYACGFLTYHNILDLPYLVCGTSFKTASRCIDVS